MPFDIHELTYLLPKSIVVVAGAPNAGKSAFLMNLARLNMHKFDTHYFSSEMGAAEFRDRLDNFAPDILPHQWRLRVWERSENFEDVIRPEGLNIVDFLEINDDFWKVGLFIRRIFDKLTTGVAFIALQKNAGSELGLGQTRGLEKARLYIAMDSHKIKIVKAKNWVNHTVNPNGMYREFKLVKGSHFIPEGFGWLKETDKSNTKE